LDWDEALVDHKIKKINMNNARPERRQRESGQKIGYAFLGIDKTQLDDFSNMKTNEMEIM
jgi:hypothetical protein